MFSMFSPLKFMSHIDRSNDDMERDICSHKYKSGHLLCTILDVLRMPWIASHVLFKKMEVNIYMAKTRGHWQNPEVTVCIIQMYKFNNLEHHSKICLQYIRAHVLKKQHASIITECHLLLLPICFSWL